VFYAACGVSLMASRPLRGWALPGVLEPKGGYVATPSGYSRIPPRKSLCVNDVTMEATPIGGAATVSLCAWMFVVDDATYPVDARVCATAS
jgi:hypothetical protein